MAHTRADWGERGIRAIHQRSHATYGSPRVQVELRETGTRCGRKRVERLMRQEGLQGCTRRRARVRTTVSDPTATRPHDLVQRAFAPAAVGGPNRLWVADIERHEALSTVR